MTLKPLPQFHLRERLAFRRFAFRPRNANFCRTANPRSVGISLRKAIASILPAILCAASLTVAHEQPAPITSQHIHSYCEAQSRDWAPIPQAALSIFAAAEDRNFFDKPPQSSTITRQIASWLQIGGSSRLLAIATAITIGETLSHDEILNWYVSTVYLGLGCYGLPAASIAYFGKPIDQLRPEETALLAALPKAPASFHPVRAPDRALQRRNFVLKEVRTMGLLSEAEAREAMQSVLNVRSPLARCKPRD